jgi:hypothetical protein
LKELAVDEQEKYQLIQRVMKRIRSETELNAKRVERYITVLGETLDTMEKTEAQKMRARLVDTSIRQDFMVSMQEDYDLLNEVLYEIVAIMLCRNQLTDIVNSLQSLHNNKSNYVEKPVGFRIPKFE